MTHGTNHALGSVSLFTTHTAPKFTAQRVTPILVVCCPKRDYGFSY